MFMANAAVPSQPVIINNNKNTNNNVVVAAAVASPGHTDGHYEVSTATWCCIIGSLFGTCGMHRCYLDQYGTCCCQVCDCCLRMVYSR